MDIFVQPPMIRSVFCCHFVTLVTRNRLLSFDGDVEHDYAASMSRQAARMASSQHVADSVSNSQWRCYCNKEACAALTRDEMAADAISSPSESLPEQMSFTIASSSNASSRRRSREPANVAARRRAVDAFLCECPDAHATAAKPTALLTFSSSSVEETPALNTSATNSEPSEVRIAYNHVPRILLDHFRSIGRQTWSKMTLDAAQHQTFAAVLRDAENIETEDDLVARLRELLVVADGSSTRRCWVPRLSYVVASEKSSEVAALYSYVLHGDNDGLQSALRRFLGTNDGGHLARAAEVATGRHSTTGQSLLCTAAKHSQLQCARVLLDYLCDADASGGLMLQALLFPQDGYESLDELLRQQAIDAASSTGSGLPAIKSNCRGPDDGMHALALAIRERASLSDDPALKAVLEDVNAASWLRMALEVACERLLSQRKRSPRAEMILPRILGWVIDFAGQLRRADPLRTALHSLPHELPSSVHQTCARAWILLEQRQMAERKKQQKSLTKHRNRLEALQLELHDTRKSIDQTQNQLEATRRNLEETRRRKILHLTGHEPPRSRANSMKVGHGQAGIVDAVHAICIDDALLSLPVPVPTASKHRRSRSGAEPDAAQSGRRVLSVPFGGDRSRSRSRSRSKSYSMSRSRSRSRSRSQSLCSTGASSHDEILGASASRRSSEGSASTNSGRISTRESPTQDILERPNVAHKMTMAEREAATVAAAETMLQLLSGEIEGLSALMEATAGGVVHHEEI